jgi:hypothetical protein
MNASKRIMLTGCSLFVLCLGSQFASASETKCSMNYNLKSWSILYKSGKGTGTISCDNGQKAKVRLRSEGGGITFGTSKIVNGHGVFSKTSSIKDLYGSYANGAAHGGLGTAGAAQGLTKGDITLSLTGKGTGVNIGIDFGSFKISKM